MKDESSVTNASDNARQTTTHDNSQPASPEAAASAAEPEDVLTFRGHMVAGAVAGTAEHLAMYPVDTIKTRMQALSHPGQQLRGSTLARATKAVIRREGIRGLYGGFWAVAAGAGPAHALYFSAYEAAKRALNGDRPGHHPLATGAAGVVATLVNDGVMVPFDVVKQRLQVARSPYKGVTDCIMKMLRYEGVGAFYRSFRTTIVMNVPFTAVHFATYESAKTAMARWAGREQEEETLLVQLLAGGTAGGVAAGVTTPLDVVKTRLQLQGVHSPQHYNTSAMIPVLKRIMAEEGQRALWSGLKPRILFHVPAAAICWGTYETSKSIMQHM
ncbi:hypothetical protein WJX74_002192 [Apatococcus lobatus]|uniref:Mitochondrial carrier protein n=1 Tax=Apatococcus lobatus TaxID=904363 RepID=A0AAW1RJ66_9CHLO